jgi:uncharacterized repeat protein (TIGR02543 family)
MGVRRIFRCNFRSVRMTTGTTPLIVSLLIGILLCPALSSVSRADLYELMTNINPSQSGMVAPYCGMGCWYTDGSRTNILATPYNGYVFDSWSGDCSGSSPSASVSMTDSKSCTANFAPCADQPVRIGASGYNNIGAAYSIAGNGDVIGMLATNLYGNLMLDRPVNITLRGGYNCGYGTNPSMSLIQGSVVIKAGSVTMDNVMLVGIPAAPPIPNLPPSSLFDYIKVVSTGETQIEFATPGKDLIAEYGDTATTIQYADVGASDDWVLQVGGQMPMNRDVRAGDGNDLLYQYGGPGPDTIYAECGAGGKTFIQAGGGARNTLTVQAASGTAHIEQYGGPAGDTLEVIGSDGSDDVLMVGGSGSDTFTYNLTPGIDIVRIYGAGGDDLLTINKNLESFTLNDGDTRQVLFTTGTGGSIIPVYGIGRIRVIGDDGSVIFFRTIPPSPPSVPTPPPDTGFDTVQVFQGGSGDVEQIAFGTPGKDKIVMYGGTGNATQYAEGSEGNDWILQVGGGGNSDQTALAGEGTDTIYQYGGQGESNQYAAGGSGNQPIIQVGGLGMNTMEIVGGIGSPLLEQYGGPAGNTMVTTGNSSNEVIVMVAGAGNDVMTYNVSSGVDTVRIYGGGGNDSLIINKRGNSFTLHDGDSGQVLFTVGSGGSTITVYEVEHIIVIGDDGSSIIYQR